MTKKKYQSETETVDEMIRLFCRKKHHSKEMCPSCKELSQYCHYRLSLCPFGDKKTFCSNCRIHCYDKEHRQRIRDVMAFSGPRMLFHHPLMAISHLIETKKEKKRLYKEEKENAG